ncbi:MAG TPA: lysylphosphatidylglycerol synthase transmembrane domain-containing protein [Thermoanaerobaculia bacterium]|nr:lysylphosphatidylglycerol synthase transmembrane domain-containing protein [Thermoanaerobaculia bacterium]
MSKLLRILLIAAVTLLLLALFLRNSDPKEVLGVLGSIRPGWFVAALLTNFSALLFRTARWRTVLGASSGMRPPLYDTFLSTAIGFMSSAILPIRAGDVVRPALLSRRTGIRFATALGTVVCERLIDLVAVLSMFLVFASTAGRALSADPATSRKAILIHSAATVATLVLLAIATLVVLLYLFRERARSLQMRVSTWLPKRVRRGWIAFFDSLSAAIEILGSPRVLARVIVFTAGIWLCLTGQFILVLYAMGRPLPYVASFLVTGMTILGISIPTPGGVGGFHKAAQMALTNFYGFGVSASVAVALVFHIVGTAPVVLTGLALFVREGMSVRQLARIREGGSEGEEGG